MSRHGNNVLAGRWESFLFSYFDSDIKAIPFVLAQVPWLSNFSIVVEVIFVFFMGLYFSQCCQTSVKQVSDN